MLHHLSTTLLGVLAALLAATAVAAAAGFTPHVEASDSMRPLLRAGDVLWLDRIRAADARVGDVVAFTHPDRRDVVLHRVRRLARRGGRLAFTTRGDANTGVERWTIERSGAVGRYAGVRVPLAGRAVAATRGLPLAIAALLSGTALAALLLRRIWR